jgi:sugar (pentulose or hexulose) kinase
MSSVPAIAIFDIGKTNKKLLVFDKAYNLIYEYAEHLPETVDDDGDPCEDVHLLSAWIKAKWNSILGDKNWDIRAVNSSAYGASFVHVDENGAPVAPLYNYLKPLPTKIKASFQRAYPNIWATTASPNLDNLNSGVLLYMLKHVKPALHARVTTSLHLPQYVSGLLTGQRYSDLTSLGCHTAMWDFSASRYASWVEAEGLTQRQAEIKPCDSTIEIRRGNKIIYSGIGLHDSSAALIPYLATRSNPFCLLSTGTWSISLNPFNPSPLTQAELRQDCLCYLSYQGTPVKAARLFSGHFHDVQVKALNDHFHKAEEHYKTLPLETLETHIGIRKSRDVARPFTPFEASTFPDYESAYAYLVEELVARQKVSTSLILTRETTDIFVDGGFSGNSLFMTLLARAFPDRRVYAASVAQASALGAALVIHSSWNDSPIRKDLLKLTPFS